MRFIVSACVFLAGFTSCSGSNGHLRKAAMADLSCPSRQLEIEQLARDRTATTYLVSGCGRSAQYSVSKKSPPVRTTEVVDVPVVAAAPPSSSNPQQQQELAAFMQQHQQRMDNQKAKQQEFFNSNNKPPQPPPRPAPIAEPAPAPPAAPPAEAQSTPGWVCLGSNYYACPDTASTTALGAYGMCTIKCMMGGNCSACVPGAGERCVRDTSRDSSCNK